MRCRWIWLFGLLAIVGSGCGSDGEVRSGKTADAQGGATSSTGTDGLWGTTGADGMDGTDGADGTDGIDAADASDGTDGTDSTSQTSGGATIPKYSGEKCPELKAGENLFDTGGSKRRFQLFLPSDPTGAPVVFMWHGLGDTSTNFSASWGVAQIAKSRNAIVVVPAVLQSGGSGILPPMWSFPNTLASGAEDKDLSLFDDTLACLDSQFGVDATRIYSLGFSSGALWTTFLTMKRSTTLAAVAIFSGGINPDMMFKYEKPAHTVKAFLSHGGAQDLYMGIIKFHEMVELYSKSLVADGNFVVLCNHGQGHNVNGPLVAAGIDFIFQHQFDDKTSPLATAGMPKSYPSYCSIESK